MPFIPNIDRKIFYRMWDVENPVANVIFYHGGGEHSGLYHSLAHALNDRGFRVWSMDHVGHGHTHGGIAEHDYVRGFAKNGKELVKLVQKHSPELPLVISGHSMGGVTTSIIMSEDDAPEVAGIVLTGTPWEPIREFDPETTIMSTNPQYMDELDIDAQICMHPGEPGFDDGKVMGEVQEKIKGKCVSWKFPVLFINGEFDPISLPQDMRQWAEKLPNARAVCMKGGHHDIVCDFCHRSVEEIIGNFIFDITCKDILR